jgi:glycosyltransferase involved in cell wall biosynthesis
VKGLDIALNIARQCPHIPFSFVEGWAISERDRSKLQQKIAALPNVKLVKSQKDMRKVYKRCKVLLAPSVCEEGYGRVVTEAQISGIPVIASRRGGLPEAVGTGGLLIDPDASIDEWVQSIREFWQNEKLYKEKSIAAYNYAQREEMSITNQIDAYERALLAARNER